jgi:hypothetical protein
MKLPEIVAELASVYHKEAFDENKVKYWLHELKLHRSDLRDRLLRAEPALKIWMPELCKDSKLSQDLRFERGPQHF